MYNIKLVFNDTWFIEPISHVKSVIIDIITNLNKNTIIECNRGKYVHILEMLHVDDCYSYILFRSSDYEIFKDLDSTTLFMNFYNNKDEVIRELQILDKNIIDLKENYFLVRYKDWIDTYKDY